MNENYKFNTIREVVQHLYEKTYITISKLEATAYITPEPVSFQDRKQGTEKKVELGQEWGKLWDCAWFNFTGKVPKDIHYGELILCIDISGEGLVVDKKGDPVQGITTTLSTFDTQLGRPGKKYVQLEKVGLFEDEIDFWVDCGCNDLFGNYIDSGRLRKAEIVTCNKEIHKLYFDMIYLQNLCTCIKDESYRLRISAALYEGAVLLQDSHFSEEAIVQTIQSLSRFLSLSSRYEEDFKLYAVGHAHIDLAWLWPIRETKRKAARTFSTALQMLNKYPDYVFGASQPQMFDWIKEGYPDLYQKVAKAIESGRFECQGGMWVEADTNISGGEALIRQFLYGKQFFRDEFGKEMKILWLPDVFGYSAALPQIMKHTGIDYFMTIKLSWSEHNEFPYHTFNWQGIDGSTVLSHMPPEGTYNSAARPESFHKSVDNYKNKDISNQALLLFGIGDGGGGPGEDHLENLTRAKTSVGIPVVKQKPAIEFFETLAKDQEKYPYWKGELYLEKHQGTYTTHAKNKKYNRKMELALRECEFACTLASSYTNFEYPKEQISSIWKEVLLYQFHDILPGSSIKRVYDESLARYKVLYNETLEVTQKAYEEIASHIQTDGFVQPVIYFNSLGWERKEIAKIDGKYKEITIPPMGWAVYDGTEFSEFVSKVVCYQESKDTWIIENGKVKVSFGEDGAITSYFDKEVNREIVPEGKRVNQYAIYQDKGDCWDIPFGYRDHVSEKPRLIETKAYDNTMEKGIRQTYQYNGSSIEVTITLKDNENMMRFAVEVDWHENEKMLRTQFPVDLNTNKATCEIQFGHIERPTHKNTSWDLARIEVPAHKWVDISESNYGVALLNDCKYGHNIWDNTMDLNILRSPKYPSEEEKGRHSLQYALLPHQGALAEADVIKQGYFFNIPLKEVRKNEVLPGAMLSQSFSQIQVEKENIIIEAVKKSENGKGYIVRLYEAKGVKSISSIYIADAKEVLLANAMEEDGQSIEINQGSISLCFSAFEIKTLKIL